MIIILEGIPTSGKTDVIKVLGEKFKSRGVSCEVFDESKRISPETYTHPDPKNSIAQLTAFLKKECSSDKKVTICCRFHLYHLNITNGSPADLVEIEKVIREYNPMLVLLQVPEDIIKQRLLYSKALHETKWQEELKRRGQSEDNAVEWYKMYQYKLLALYHDSTLPKIMYHTESLNFDEVADDIYEQAINVYGVKP
ncbi:MAG: hypothetical protein WC773_04115 [Patescibacteria group bacterium]|jgi:hypothetical protein